MATTEAGRQSPNPHRSRLHQIIFKADTQEGRMFDLLLFVAILASVLVVVLESVPSVRMRAMRDCSDSLQVKLAGRSLRGGPPLDS